jgi:hypothetical protein
MQEIIEEKFFPILAQNNDSDLPFKDYLWQLVEFQHVKINKTVATLELFGRMIRPYVTVKVDHRNLIEASTNNFHQ